MKTKRRFLTYCYCCVRWNSRIGQRIVCLEVLQWLEVCPVHHTNDGSCISEGDANLFSMVPFQSKVVMLQSEEHRGMI
jgi:hypothetical protein